MHEFCKDGSWDVSMQDELIVRLTKSALPLKLRDNLTIWDKSTQNTFTILIFFYKLQNNIISSTLICVSL